VHDRVIERQFNRYHITAEHMALMDLADVNSLGEIYQLPKHNIPIW